MTSSVKEFHTGTTRTEKKLVLTVEWESLGILSFWRFPLVLRFESGLKKLFKIKRNKTIYNLITEGEIFPKPPQFQTHKAALLQALLVR